MPSSQIIPRFHRRDPADCKHVRTRLQPCRWHSSGRVCPVWNVTGHRPRQERRGTGRALRAPPPRSAAARASPPGPALRPALPQPRTGAGRAAFPLHGWGGPEPLSPLHWRRSARAALDEHLRAAGTTRESSVESQGRVFWVFFLKALKIWTTWLLA